MKLIRFGEKGMEKPGIQDTQGRWLDVSAFGSDYTAGFFENDGLSKLTAWLKENQEQCPEVSQNTRLGTPIAETSKIVCVGLNYARHAQESGMEIPKEPVLFFKATSAICGPNDVLIIPPGSQKTDWEVELGVVIGSKASYVSEEDAMDYVAGYVLHNDYSERTYQLEQSGQWVKGKSCDSFAPLGPWLVSQDEIEDPQQLDLWLEVNGKRLQDSNTSDMVFGVAELVSYISHFMTLLPGDIISTGTPSGVGLGLDPPVYLKPGDRVRLGIEGLGEAQQTAVAYK